MKFNIFIYTRKNLLSDSNLEKLHLLFDRNEQTKISSYVEVEEHIAYELEPFIEENRNLEDLYLFFGSESNPFTLKYSTFENELGMLIVANDIKLSDTNINLVNELAELFEPVFMSVYPRWEANLEDKEEYVVHIPTFRDFREFGMTPLGNINYWGEFISKQLPDDLFAQLGVCVEHTEWGGRKVTLMNDCKESDLSLLGKKQSSIMAELRKTGVVGSHGTVDFDYEPPKNWIEPNFN
jgi:hypothetical protein